jgi:hypothetical protein
MKKLFLFLFISVGTFAVNAQEAPPKPPVEDFVGRYVFPDGSVVPDVTVAVSGGALTMSSAAGTSALVELGIDSFSVVEFSGFAVFKRGDDKKVKSVHIEAGGYILDGQKQNGINSWSFTIYYRPNKELVLPKK